MAVVVQPFVSVLGIVPIISYITWAAAGAGLFVYVCIFSFCFSKPVLSFPPWPSWNWTGYEFIEISYVFLFSFGSREGWGLFGRCFDKGQFKRRLISPYHFSVCGSFFHVGYIGLVIGYCWFSNMASTLSAIAQSQEYISFRSTVPLRRVSLSN